MKLSSVIELVGRAFYIAKQALYQTDSNRLYGVKALVSVGFPFKFYQSPQTLHLNL